MNNYTNNVVDLPRKLYVRITENHLCFARYELRREPVFAFANYQLQVHKTIMANLKDAAQTEPLLSAPAQHTKVLVNTPTTFVPLSEFQEEQCTLIYDFLFPSEQKRRVFYETIPSAGAVLLFSLEETVCQEFESLFENVSFCSWQTSVLRHFSQKRSLGTHGKHIFVYGHENGVDLAVFEDRRMILANSFAAQGATDIAYYAFGMAQQALSDPLKANFYVAGNQQRRELIAGELLQFTENVFQLNPTAEFNRHKVSTEEDVPYDLMTLLIE